MSHCVAGQEEGIIVTSMSGGDAHNSSVYSESSLKEKATEGFGCCVTAICSSFQFTTTLAADGLFYPGLTSEWH